MPFINSGALSLPAVAVFIRQYLPLMCLSSSYATNKQYRCNSSVQLCTHTHNRFTALWNLSGTTRVSRYQKKHSPTTLIMVINHP